MPHASNVGRQHRLAELPNRAPADPMQLAGDRRHVADPYVAPAAVPAPPRPRRRRPPRRRRRRGAAAARSEEHTSELQSQSNLVCRLLLEKKNTTTHLPPSRFDISLQPFVGSFTDNAYTSSTVIYLYINAHRSRTSLSMLMMVTMARLSAL